MLPASFEKVAFLVASSLLLSPVLSQEEPSLSNCNELESCSPDFCDYVDNDSCDLPPNDETNLMNDINDMHCNDECNAIDADTCNNLYLQHLIHNDNNNNNNNDNNHIKFGYCTDSFFILWSDGLPNHNVNLNGIPRPPGGGEDGSYQDECVMRTYTQQSFTYKIPIYYQLLNDGEYNYVPYPTGPSGHIQGGGIAVAVNGVPVFPPRDNAWATVWEQCEADKCSAHAGKGQDYHYHGDPFGDECMYNAAYSDANYYDYENNLFNQKHLNFSNKNMKNMRNIGNALSKNTKTSQNYTHQNSKNLNNNNDNGDSHPPLIGWGFDGIPIYGRYLNSYELGSSYEFDDCGGHKHDNFEYHYHSWVNDDTYVESTDDPMNPNDDKYFTSYYFAPRDCWKSDISLIEAFWQIGYKQANYDNSLTTPDTFNVKNRNDYHLLLPCCDTNIYYAVDDVNINSIFS